MAPSARPLIRLPSLVRSCFRRQPDFATNAVACAPAPLQLSIFLSTYLNRFCVYPFTHTRASPHPEGSSGATAPCIYRYFTFYLLFGRTELSFFLPREQPGKALSITTAIHPHLFRPCPHANDARGAGIFRESGLSVASSGLLCQRLISICRTENEGTGKLIKRDYV